MGLGGGQLAQVLVIGAGHGEGPGRGVPLPAVRGPGRSPGNFGVSRSLYVSFSVFWLYKLLQISGVLQFEFVEKVVLKCNLNVI